MTEPPTRSPQDVTPLRHLDKGRVSEGRLAILKVFLLTLGAVVLLGLLLAVIIGSAFIALLVLGIVAAVAMVHVVYLPRSARALGVTVSSLSLVLLLAGVALAWLIWRSLAAAALAALFWVALVFAPRFGFRYLIENVASRGRPPDGGPALRSQSEQTNRMHGK